MPITFASLNGGLASVGTFFGFNLNIVFANLPLALLALLVVPVIWLAYKRRRPLGLPNVGMQSNIRSVPLVGHLPNVLLVVLFAALALAIARPQLPDVGEKEVIVTRDFIIATDISGSMDGEISDPDQVAFAGTATDAEGKPIKITRRIVAEKGIAAFVKERKGDRVGLFLFDTDTYYSWPLSTDIRLIELKNGGSSKFSGGGTDFAGVNGPIPAAIVHFKELGAANSKVLIMVTDGEDSIAEERRTELLQELAKQNIKVYTLAIGWSNPKADNDLRKLTEATGGLIINVGNATEMRDGFAKINDLEKSRVEVQKTVTYRDIYQYFLMVAFAAALLYLVASALMREDA